MWQRQTQPIAPAILYPGNNYRTCSTPPVLVSKQEQQKCVYSASAMSKRSATKANTACFFNNQSRHRVYETEKWYSSAEISPAFCCFQSRNFFFCIRTLHGHILSVRCGLHVIRNTSLVHEKVRTRKSRPSETHAHQCTLKDVTQVWKCNSESLGWIPGEKKSIFL